MRHSFFICSLLRFFSESSMQDSISFRCSQCTLSQQRNGLTSYRRSFKFVFGVPPTISVYFIANTNPFLLYKGTSYRLRLCLSLLPSDRSDNVSEEATRHWRDFEKISRLPVIFRDYAVRSVLRSWLIKNLGFSGDSVFMFLACSLVWLDSIW